MMLMPLTIRTKRNLLNMSVAVSRSKHNMTMVKTATMKPMKMRMFTSQFVFGDGVGSPSMATF